MEIICAFHTCKKRNHEQPLLLFYDNDSNVQQHVKRCGDAKRLETESDHLGKKSRLRGTVTGGIV